MAKGSAVVLDSIVKDYRRGAIAVRALDNVSFAVMPGTVTAVAGRSGSGKSTLMHLIGALDRPTSGRVVVGGRDLSDMGDEEATAFRRTGVGFVFQFFNLIPTLEAWENVAVPGLLGGAKLSSLRNDAVLLLDRVGLGDRAHHRPGELSGGQLQRVALARALFNDPPLILADEPTGNLDSHSGAAVLALLRSLSDEDQRTVILVTHDQSAASVADRVVTIVDGVIQC